MEFEDKTFFEIAKACGDLSPSAKFSLDRFHGRFMSRGLIDAQPGKLALAIPPEALPRRKSDGSPLLFRPPERGVVAEAGFSDGRLVSYNVTARPGDELPCGSDFMQHVAEDGMHAMLDSFIDQADDRDINNQFNPKVWAAAYLIYAATFELDGLVVEDEALTALAQVDLASIFQNMMMGAAERSGFDPSEGLKQMKEFAGPYKAFCTRPEFWEQEEPEEEEVKVPHDALTLIGILTGKNDGYGTGYASAWADGVIESFRADYTPSPGP